MTAPAAPAGRPFPGGIMIRPNPFLGLLPAKLWKKTKDYFGYIAEFLPATNAVTTPAAVTISGDAAFLLMEINRTVYDVTNTIVKADAPFTLQVIDSQNRNLFQIPAALDNISGTGTAQGYMPFYKLYDPGTTLTLNLTNLTATSYNVRLALLGIKVFNYDDNG
jgi:hypothetical protein